MADAPAPGPGGAADGGRLGQILDGTYDCLVRYGVRRTTMDDIAGAVGISRSALYQYVRSKDDAFRRLARRFHEEALARARAAAEAEGPVEGRVRGVLGAKLGLVLRLHGDSPHTAELLDAKARLFGDICTEFCAEVRALLTGLFTEAGTAAVDPGDAADICIAVVVGLEGEENAARLLGPAADAITAGLLRAR
ncbi:TetR/AcrR family transcriptional regulator [Nocardiopsis sp. CNT-189]|uniref:TetR/AcrR family transcriptional regulator n=1 Tax=Nocardiopsis oceanisediminis TaxID=2816862 RepID=UPI003B2A8FC0